MKKHLPVTPRVAMVVSNGHPRPLEPENTSGSSPHEPVVDIATGSAGQFAALDIVAERAERLQRAIVSISAVSSALAAAVEQLKKERSDSKREIEAARASLEAIRRLQD